MGDVADANGGEDDGNEQGVRRYTASALWVFDGLLLTSPAYTMLTSSSVKRSHQKKINKFCVCCVYLDAQLD
jgi:hypothetical protein